MGFLSSLAVGHGAAAAPTAVLDAVKARGHVICGAGSGKPGFATADETGRWSGLSVDFCRAIAAATLGDADAFKMRVLTASDRFKALQGGEIDVMVQGSSWTLTRDTELGIRFTGILFYDGQGFMTGRENAVTSVLELSGASVCTLSSSNGAEAVVDYFASKRMRVELKISDRWDQLVKLYAARQCSVLSGDVSDLAVARTKLDAPDQHILLPEMITKAPVGPAVRQGDDSWFGIVRWVAMALTAAEELGVTRDNVQSMKASDQVDVQRFLSAEGSLGQGLGLSAEWVARTIGAVGNYGEIFDRNLGQGSPLALRRGLNALWLDGGLMYAVPFR